MARYLEANRPGLLHRLVYAVSRGVFSGVRCKLIDVENLPTQPTILAANHTSFLDPIMLGLRVPLRLHFLARDTLFKPIMGSILRAIWAHPIRRGSSNHELFSIVSEVLQTGASIVIFPEGKRGNNDSQLLPLRDGAAAMALRNNVPIVPVWIRGNYELWPSHRKLPKLIGDISMRFGQPLSPANIEIETPGAFKQAAREMTEKLRTAMLELAKQET